MTLKISNWKTPGHDGIRGLCFKKFTTIHERPTLKMDRCLLYIDQHILNESKTRCKNLAMARIDFRNAYNMALQSWIINCLKIYKISDEVINFIEKTMTTWRVELTLGGKSLAEVKIHRGIFQGDALSPLLFTIAMMPHNHILRKCTAGYNLLNRRKR